MMSTCSWRQQAFCTALVLPLLCTSAAPARITPHGFRRVSAPEVARKINSILTQSLFSEKDLRLGILFDEHLRAWAGNPNDGLTPWTTLIENAISGGYEREGAVPGFGVPVDLLDAHPIKVASYHLHPDGASKSHVVEFAHGQDLFVVADGALWLRSAGKEVRLVQNQDWLVGSVIQPRGKQPHRWSKTFRDRWQAFQIEQYHLGRGLGEYALEQLNTALESVLTYDGPTNPLIEAKVSGVMARIEKAAQSGAAYLEPHRRGMPGMPDTQNWAGWPERTGGFLARFPDDLTLVVAGAEGDEQDDAAPEGLALVERGGPGKPSARVTTLNVNLREDSDEVEESAGEEINLLTFDSLWANEHLLDDPKTIQWVETSIGVHGKRRGSRSQVGQSGVVHGFFLPVKLLEKN